MRAEILEIGIGDEAERLRVRGGEDPDDLLGSRDGERTEQNRFGNRRECRGKAEGNSQGGYGEHRERSVMREETSNSSHRDREIARAPGGVARRTY